MFKPPDKKKRKRNKGKIFIKLIQIYSQDNAIYEDWEQTI